MLRRTLLPLEGDEECELVAHIAVVLSGSMISVVSLFWVLVQINFFFYRKRTI
jgi:hypothetical protein